MVTSIGYRYDQHISLKENIRLHVSTIVANIERLEEVDIILPRLKDLISSVLFGGSIGLSKTFDPEEWYVDQAVMYADSMEIFDLAHEYAHTVCGHLTDSKTVHSYVANRGTQQEVTELAYSHKHEFEADINGLHYMLGTLHNRRTSGSLPPGSWVFLPPWSLCGPTILFQFFDVIERSKSIITKGQEYPSESSLGSHPPPLVRLNQLRQHIHNIWGTSSWGESLLEPSLMIDKPDMKKGFCSFRGLELLPHLYV